MGFKVLTAETLHEANTFSVDPTGIQAFRDRFLLRGTRPFRLIGFDGGLSDIWRRLHGPSQPLGR